MGLGIVVAVRRLASEARRRSKGRNQDSFLRAKEELDAATGEMDRWIALTDYVLVAVDRIPNNEVVTLANELLATAQAFSDSWNFGNAIHKGHLALGRVDLREGRVTQAHVHLLEAGRTPGSPQLDSFGPNMILAKELLERGETEIVLEYFQLCRKFWRMKFFVLRGWTADVRGGQIPDFGPNLLY